MNRNKHAKRPLNLRANTIRVLTLNEHRAVGGGLQATMVGTVCATCAFSCDPAACQPPPSGAQGGAL